MKIQDDGSRYPKLWVSSLTRVQEFVFFVLSNSPTPLIYWVVSVQRQVCLIQVCLCIQVCGTGMCSQVCVYRCVVCVFREAGFGPRCVVCREAGEEDSQCFPWGRGLLQLLKLRGGHGGRGSRGLQQYQQHPVGGSAHNTHGQTRDKR